MPLGTGHNTAEIYERGGERKLFTVPAVASLQWGRQLDGISRASFTARPANAPESMSWESCCGLLATIHPWAHELVIWRDGERVWEGPVRRPVQSREGLTVLASDVLGWTERRVVAADRTATNVSVRDEADLTITNAFAAGDPNVLAYVTALGDAATLTSVEVKANAGYYAAVLADLTNAGLFYTVVGRRIILWADTTLALGVTSILNPTRHLVGDLEIAREGDELATRAVVTNDDGASGSDGGTDAFYGRVERVVTGTGIVGATALAQAAQRWRKLRDPAPQTLSIPDGSTLHCDAPFTIAELVPGVLTPVKVGDLCWPVETTMMLTGVQVTQDSEGEKVGVTYAPITGDEDFDA